MGVTVREATTKNPITYIGETAGVCWNAPTDDPEKNYRRGLDCIEANHGRTLEWVNVELVIDGYSARVIREWYTHIGGAPSRLQTSTRYVKWEGGLEDNIVLPAYIQRRLDLSESLRGAFYLYANAFLGLISKCQDEGVPLEDVAMFYPLGMKTKIVDKRNLRNLIDMSHQRLCSRAYHEYRKLMHDVCKALREYSEEWKYIVDNYIKPKCEVTGYCPEKRTCGRKPRQSVEKIQKN